jgi:hypothetical protein
MPYFKYRQDQAATSVHICLSGTCCNLLPTHLGLRFVSRLASQVDPRIAFPDGSCGRSRASLAWTALRHGLQTMAHTSVLSAECGIVVECRRIRRSKSPPRQSGDDSWHRPGQTKVPAPRARFSPATEPGSVALEFELAPPEPDNIVLDFHPAVPVHGDVHVTAFRASM